MPQDAFDPSLCLSCETCTPGCTAVADTLTPMQVSAMQQARFRLLDSPQGPVPRQCWHCAQAACLEVCPAGAMRRSTEGGLVWVDRSRCIGCWMCVLACPFGAVVPSGGGRFAVKCDGCIGQPSPACAGTCFARDLLFDANILLEAARLRRARMAEMGFGWPGVERHPPPSANPVAAPQPASPASTSLRYVVVGAGIAAVRAVEALRAVDPEGQVTVISDEALPPYSRVLLSHYVSGLRDGASLALRPPDWYGRLGVQLLAGDGARRLDVERRRVVLSSGREVFYDRLLLATGALPLSLPIPGTHLSGVVGLRNLADAETIRSLAPKQAVVVGGGFIGLKAAEALHKLGARVVIVEKLSHLLPQMLDETAARLVRLCLEEHGIRVITGTGVQEIEGRERVSGVLLEGGERIAGDLVVVGVGVRPNVDWLRGSGIRMGRGVLVDDRMRTNVPDVWAAGDLVETRHLVTGLSINNAIWPAAAAQGRVAGANMAGRCEVYEGSLPMNTLDVLGLAVASFGQVKEGNSIVEEDGGGRYLKKVYRNGQLVGAVLVGDLREAGRLLAQLQREQADKKARRPSALDGLTR